MLLTGHHDEGITMSREAVAILLERGDQLSSKFPPMPEEEGPSPLPESGYPKLTRSSSAPNLPGVAVAVSWRSVILVVSPASLHSGAFTPAIDFFPGSPPRISLSRQGRCPRRGGF